MTVPLTALPGASYTVTASCRAQGQVFAYTPVTITVTAASMYALTISASALSPGASTTVSGANCVAPKGSTGPLSVDATLVNDESIPVDVAAVVPLANGSWSATLTVPANAQPGVYLVAANCDQYVSGQNYAPQSVSIQPAPVSPATTVLRYRGATSGPAGSQVTLAAGLKTDGVGVAGVPVTFTLGSASVTATTNSGGVARALVTAPQAGAATVSAAFSGNSGFAASPTGSVNFSVGASLAPSKLKWTGTASVPEYSPATLSAKLTSSGGTAAAGRAVTFVTPGGVAQAAVTNSSGVATVTASFDVEGSATVGVVYNGTGDSAYASSKTSVTVTVTAPFVPSAIACSTTSKCTIVGSDGMSEVSTNGGQTWSQITPVTSFNLTSVTCPSTTLCVAVGLDGTILVSSNGGTSWTVETDPSPMSLSTVKCATATDCVAVGFSGTVLTTVDSGTTWTAQGSGTSLNFDALACPTLSTCLATANNGTTSGTFLSTDSGVEWSSVSEPEPSGPVTGQDQLVCTSAAKCLEGSGEGPIYRTTNSGLTWAQVAYLYGATMWCSSATKCLAVTDDGVGTSKNGGATWTLAYGFYPYGTTQDMACTSSQCVLLIQGFYSDASTYSSSDDGGTWQGPVGL
jgi:photosystem II stability/assembly factor-like uncharacterized protein